MMRIIGAIAVLLLLGCENKPNELTSQDIEYKEYPKGTSFNPPIFDKGFENGHEEFDEYGFKYVFSVINAGDLVLSSGKLVICEPLYLFDQEPLELDLSPGKYPVYIAEAVIEKDNKVVDKRNALVRIKLGEGVPVEWKYIWTFGADGGTGGYIDFSALREVVKNGDSENFSKELLSTFAKKSKIIEPFEKNHTEYHQYVNLKYKNSNLIAFSSG